MKCRKRSKEKCKKDEKYFLEFPKADTIPAFLNKNVRAREKGKITDKMDLKMQFLKMCGRFSDFPKKSYETVANLLKKHF